MTAPSSTKPYHIFTEEQRVKFWKRVNQGPPSECWDYHIPASRFGYGQWSVKVGGKCWNFRVHRLAYFFHNGNIPEGKLILHRCDNPLCCNPHHLYAGTAKDNMDDRRNRGRSNVKSGADSHASRLSIDDVVAIRQLAASGTYQHVIAAKFGVGQSEISRIVTRKRWA